jgi:hypothetical protein
MLEKYHRRQDASETTETLPLPEIVDNEEEWEVEEILEKKKRAGKIWYLIKWVGYPEEYNEWVPKDNMANAEELRKVYEEGTKRKRGRPAKKT